jgi:hypothetical protein
LEDVEDYNPIPEEKKADIVEEQHANEEEIYRAPSEEE